jgi:2-keto-4-pentenoate hydratase/2-oxohepta-3-ene-1,7-dioic acid hydratase in catechol pathway
MDHVWGYTIINGKFFASLSTRGMLMELSVDMTARERQRDHKQFYLGKSPDTFCPMVKL